MSIVSLCNRLRPPLLHSCVFFRAEDETSCRKLLDVKEGDGGGAGGMTPWFEPFTEWSTKDEDPPKDWADRCSKDEDEGYESERLNCFDDVDSCKFGYCILLEEEGEDSKEFFSSGGHLIES